MRSLLSVVALLALVSLAAATEKDQILLDPLAQENVAMLSMHETRIEKLAHPVPEKVTGMWKDGVEYVESLEEMREKVEAKAVVHPQMDHEEIDTSFNAFVQMAESIEETEPTNGEQLAADELAAAQAAGSDPIAAADAINQMDARVAMVEGQSEASSTAQARADATFEQNMQNRIMQTAGGQAQLEQEGIWDSIKKAGSAVISGAKKAGSVMISGAKALGGAAMGIAGSVGGAVADMDYVYKDPPMNPQQYANLASSAEPWFKAFRRDKFERKSLAGGMRVKSGGANQYAAYLEECGGCLFVMQQVQMDVGQTRLQKVVFDSIIANCRDAMTTPIFFSGCEMIMASVDTVAIDYTHGHGPRSICVDRGLCKVWDYGK